MKLYLYLGCFSVATFFLSACGPTINCSSPSEYNQSVNKVIAKIKQSDSKSTRDVELFIRSSSAVHGGMDRNVCAMNSTEVNSYVHNYLRNRYKDIKDEAQKNLSDAMNSAQKGLDKAFGDD